ncbi:hypothetical protein L210DRAFT_3564404 [Boletus edulis BED1]|uniref:WD40 repeat-like protein n=1 Tax=Boletus edulis BED1 TaxID=1328754 RepID=A0AAD4BGQ7_BOLED|nr:hypothetical protein L210DRAFT_3564404 [Boletus edulis BED1]
MFATYDESQSPSSTTTSTLLPLVHAKTFSQLAPIVDFAWYPGASRHNPPAFCFVASVRDCPIKLLDGNDGRLRASYSIVDHRERHIAPHSLAFNLTADKLYCGFEDAIEIFDVQRPSEGERLSTTPSKKSKDGLKGIISSLAFSYSPEYYAAGSFTPASHVADNIALFNESTFEPVLSIGGVARWEKGGVTQLMFNPTRPHVLYAAFRRSERLWSWDLRGDASMPLCCFSRGAVSDGSDRDNLTNQRRQFDVEGSGRWLASGTQLGKIAIYDLETESGEPDQGEVGGETRHARPALLYGAHGDAVGAVVFHPLEPLLLSVSGSRCFDDMGPTTGMPGDSDSDSESSDEGSSENVDVVSRLRERPRPSVRDASIKMWDFSGPVGV